MTGAIASAFGADPSKTVADDLARFKRQVESGKVPTKDEVDIASEQSFPASDPPSSDPNPDSHSAITPTVLDDDTEETECR